MVINPDKINKQTGERYKIIEKESEYEYNKK